MYLGHRQNPWRVWSDPRPAPSHVLEPPCGACCSLGLGSCTGHTPLSAESGWSPGVSAPWDLLMCTPVEIVLQIVMLYYRLLLVI